MTAFQLDDADTVEPLRHGDPDRPTVTVADWAARSSPGLVRADNEDSWGEAHACVFAVADGMGGAAGGREASTMAVAHLLSIDPRDGWVSALRRLSCEVRRRCAADGFPDAGSTLVAVVVDRFRCVTLHVGDSRIYRLRRSTLQRLTTDHNLETLLREQGGRPPSAEERSELRALTSFLGNPEATQRVDVGTVAVEAGDRLLLCTDGVHGQLSPAVLAELTGRGTCRQAAELLVAAADAAGGRDNATALVVELDIG